MPFGYAIAVDQDILRVSAFVVLRLQMKTRLEHAVQAGYHLLSSSLDLQVRWPLPEPLVYRSHNSRYAWGVR